MRWKFVFRRNVLLDRTIPYVSCATLFRGGEPVPRNAVSWKEIAVRSTSDRSSVGSVAALAVMAAWSVTAVPTAHATPSCDGLPATIVGSADGDSLTGTNGDDVIVGLGGDDTIIGLAGNDRVCAGDGDDTVYGEFVVVPDELPGVPAPGPLEDLSDRVFGEAGDDVLIGNSGTAVITVSAAYIADNDHIDGGTGSDVISGGPRRDGHGRLGRGGGPQRHPDRR
ncbi:hypothetical protein AB0H12_45095 [Actinosynnema sp. NPDC023794]